MRRRRRRWSRNTATAAQGCRSHASDPRLRGCPRGSQEPTCSWLRIVQPLPPARGDSTVITGRSTLLRCSDALTESKVRSAEQQRGLGVPRRVPTGVKLPPIGCTAARQLQRAECSTLSTGISAAPPQHCCQQAAQKGHTSRLQTTAHHPQPTPRATMSCTAFAPAQARPLAPRAARRSVRVQVH